MRKVIIVLENNQLILKINLWQSRTEFSKSLDYGVTVVLVITILLKPFSLSKMTIGCMHPMSQPRAGGNFEPPEYQYALPQIPPAEEF